MTPERTAAHLIAGQIPTEEQMRAYWRATDEGLRPRAETVAVLAALSARPSDTGLMRSFVQYVRDSAPPVALRSARQAVNIVGTGGGISTFNISTSAAFVVAAAGGQVLKSGSSAYSSSVGSGDILNALGLSGAKSDDVTDAMLAETGLAFAAQGRYAPICKRLAIAAMPLNFKVIGRFVNALGPLISPYRMRAHVIGTATPTLFRQIHGVAASLDIPALVVHAHLGVDELLSICPNTCQWSNRPSPSLLDPRELDLQPGTPDALAGGDLQTNIALMTALLKGKAGVVATQTVALNAGAALYAGGAAPDLAAGTQLALTCLADGAPYAKLEQARAFLKQQAPRVECVA
ncbi:hypothetical protein KUH32_00135 [Thalassococcus sp. CAU 1522]|uniref:Glycosyl transferase family 3 domain-containing protein n=1 Tax=Thalassococcus arenae TaxID=2851652 RepID=A0ABS6N2C3_9RHOB|nr:hypothetical protein [Thalassococcus arenae]MBV2358169.1 hypothetical protein [Thalassococcus arenae]